MPVIKMADLELSGKRVLIREDLNVPVADGKVTSDARIRAALPTIEAALAANAAVMLVSHLGRPTEGEPEDKFSLRPVADRIGELLDREVPLDDDQPEDEERRNRNDRGLDRAVEVAVTGGLCAHHDDGEQQADRDEDSQRLDRHRDDPV